jgi:hypothetical protein
MDSQSNLSIAKVTGECVPVNPEADSIDASATAKFSITTRLAYFLSYNLKFNLGSRCGISTGKAPRLGQYGQSSRSTLSLWVPQPRTVGHRQFMALAHQLQGKMTAQLRLRLQRRGGIKFPDCARRRT